MVVTQDEAILRVACTIFAEAKGESLAGKRAVASVIYTRAGDLYTGGRDGGWQRSLVRTCRAGAFSTWNSGWPKAPDMRQPAQRKAWRESYELARQVVCRTFQPTIQSRDYHEASIRPYWSKGMTLLCQIDNHKFYK
jgi:spore germination cell wall hydrolase CwlJ-like protein